MDLWTLLGFPAGILLLIGGAEFLVRGASNLARSFGVSALVIGLTVVAYGTSAPELAVAIRSVYEVPPMPGIALGNVVGSNIANVLLVLGTSAAVAPLIISRHLVRVSVPIMIAASFAVLLMALDGRIARLEGAVLALAAFVYTVYAIRGHRPDPAEGDTSADRPARPAYAALVIQLLGIVVGLAGLLVGARLLVAGAVVVAHKLGVSDLVVGLTVVAIGTSLPEIATSVVAGVRGQRDIAVGNVVGSNIINLLLVLGVGAAVAPHGIDVAAPALRFDIPVMIATAVACLPVFVTGHVIARWEGFLFLAYYVAYALFLFLDATDHDALGAFSVVMLAFIVPLTVATLIALCFRGRRTRLPEQES